MVYLSPQLADDILKQKAQRSPTGNASNLLAGHGAMQAANTGYVQSAGRNLNLRQNALDFAKDFAGRSLAQNQGQFNRSLGLQRNVMDYNRGQRNLATGIAGAGLGVSVLNDIASRKRAAQQMKILDSMIDQTKQNTTDQGVYYNTLLRFLREQYQG